MRFYSTAGEIKGVSFREAVLEGIAPDGGLYLPEAFPKIDAAKVKGWKELAFFELSIEIAKVFFAEMFTAEEINALCEEAFNFPLTCLAFPERMYALELFHGPSLSFKDVGARFLAALLRKWEQERIVLVATSGDTGSAVGLALKGIPGIKVYILYPQDKVTPSQEQQFTTIGGNVTALQVKGSYEQCQQLMREALLDPELKGKVTTGNSQNIARIIAQSFYYFYAYAQLPSEALEVVFSVPCGNFGHLISGMIAQRMGLPVSRFIAATNRNNEVPLFLHGGVFEPHEAYSTMAVSMDVGNPSNFPRLLKLYENSIEKMRHNLLGVDFTDVQIGQAIQEMFTEYGYLLDPHSAVSFLALKQYLKLEKKTHFGIFFATAHPAKFLESLKPLVQVSSHIPERLAGVFHKQKEYLTIPADYENFKETLLSSTPSQSPPRF